MGTSVARKAPQKGAFWRKAKAAAAQYAAAGPAARLSVAEVVARYALALTPLDRTHLWPTVSLPAVVRTAAALGMFYEAWEAHGCQAALEYCDVLRGTAQTWEDLLPMLLEALAGPGASLDEAVARTALLDHFEDMGLLADLHTPITMAAGALPLPAADAVWHFLACALACRLNADLGETMEYRAPTLAEGRQRLAAIKAHILAQLNLLIPLSGEAERWESQVEGWLQNFLTLLGSHHDR